MVDLRRKTYGERDAVYLGVMLTALVACSSQGAAGGSCLPGATKEDCNLCAVDIPSCDRACPKVDCSVFPTPVVCQPLCGTSSCCECRNEGSEYRWTQSHTTIKCKTQQEAACDDLRIRWNAIVSRADVLRCADNVDCVVVSASSSCNGDILIDEGRGTAVNGDVYRTTEGGLLEQAYRRQNCAGVWFDVAPPLAACTAGVCQAIPRSCLPPPDLDGGRGD